MQIKKMEIESKIVGIFVTVFVTITLGYIASKIANSQKTSIFGAVGIIFIIASIATVTITSFDSCYSKKNTIVEQKMHPLIGIWIETYETKDSKRKNYGVAYFEVDSLSGKIYFHGRAYDDDGSFIGSWQSKYSSLENHIFIYMYSGRSNTNAPLRDGFGKINFIPKSDGKFFSGTGFYNSLSDTTARMYSIDRIIENNEIELAKSKPEEFIRNYQLK